MAQPTSQLGPYPYPYVNGRVPYDWTGLTANGTRVGTNGTSTSGTFTAYASYNSPGLVIGGSDDQKDSVLVSGTATYEWLWTPTGSNAGASAPSLYVLARVSGATILRPNGGNGNGLSGSGTLNYSSSVPDYFYNTQNSVTQYKVLPAPGSANAVASVSPTFQGTVSGTASSSGLGMFSLNASACPIVVSNPNPMNRPDLGDGTNQSVYDATTPSGLLNFPGAIQAVGAAAADTAWIMRDPTDINGPHVGLTVDLPAESVAQNCNLYDQTILASVPANTIAVKNGSYNGPSSSLADGFRFLGLPKQNSGLGNHLVTLTVDGNTSQQAHIQTFFTGVDANGNMVANYPNAASNLGLNNSVILNWYYYYNQIYASTGSYDGTVSGSYTEETGSYQIHIGNDIVTGHYLPPNSAVAGAVQNIKYSFEEPVFILTDPTDTKAATCVRLAGYIYIPALFGYIYICEHEKGHQSADKDGTIDLPSQSADLDSISDDWEYHHHMNYNSPDTTAPSPGMAGAYGTADATGKLPGGDVPDEELVADTSGPISEVLNNLKDYNLDWAIGGLQNGKPYYLQPDPITKAAPSGFYLWFTPVTGGQPTNYGTPYHVTSLSDITSNHPDLPKFPKMQVVTSWTQMYNASPQ